MENEEKIKVKVGGQEFEVTLDELRSGYMRQADYTRKTQELAEEKRALEATKQELAEAIEVWETLKNNPDIVERIVKELEGGEVEEKTPVFNEDRYLDHIARIEAELEELRFRTAYPDANIEEVMEFAVKNEIPKLEVAYKAMQFDKMKQEPEISSEETSEQEETGEKSEGQEEKLNPLEARDYTEILQKAGESIFE